MTVGGGSDGEGSHITLSEVDDTEFDDRMSIPPRSHTPPPPRSQRADGNGSGRDRSHVRGGSCPDSSGRSTVPAAAVPAAAAAESSPSGAPETPQRALYHAYDGSSNADSDSDDSLLICTKAGGEGGDDTPQWLLGGGLSSARARSEASGGGVAGAGSTAAHSRHQSGGSLMSGSRVGTQTVQDEESSTLTSTTSSTSSTTTSSAVSSDSGEDEVNPSALKLSATVPQLSARAAHVSPVRSHGVQFEESDAPGPRRKYPPSAQRKQQATASATPHRDGECSEETSPVSGHSYNSQGGASPAPPSGKRLSPQRRRASSPGDAPHLASVPPGHRRAGPSSEALPPMHRPKVSSSDSLVPQAPHPGLRHVSSSDSLVRSPTPVASPLQAHPALAGRTHRRGMSSCESLVRHGSVTQGSVHSQGHPALARGGSATQAQSEARQVRKAVRKERKAKKEKRAHRVPADVHQRVVDDHAEARAEIARLRADVDRMERSVFASATERARLSAELNQSRQEVVRLEGAVRLGDGQLQEKTRVLDAVLKEQMAVVAERDTAAREMMATAEKVAALEANVRSMQAAMEDAFMIAEGLREKERARRRREKRGSPQKRQPPAAVASASPFAAS